MFIVNFEGSTEKHSRLVFVLIITMANSILIGVALLKYIFS